MYRKKNSDWLTHLDFELIDIIALELGQILSFFFRHRDIISSENDMYIKTSFWLVVFDIIVMVFMKSYKDILQRNKWQELKATVMHIVAVESILVLYEYIIKEANEYSRTVFLVGGAIAIVISYFSRCFWKKVVRRSLMQEKNQSKMLLISTAKHANFVINALKKKEYQDFKISAICLMGDEKEFSTDEKCEVFYGKEQLMEYIRQDVVDEVFIDVFEEKEKLKNMIDTFLMMGITVHIGMGYLPDDMPNQMIGKIGEASALTTSIKVASGWQLTLKRAMDICGALVGLLFTGIAYLFVAPAIKHASPGPVFFKQPRVGKNGRTFYIYKFRSMYMDAEERKKELMDQNEMNGLMFKMENDPRIIGSEKGPGKGIGNFIRKTSIDELPQFWNILKGDMSLIGTRPPTVNEFEKYDLHHKIRLSMKPGLTGMWQVSGRSDITDFEEVVRLDTQYIENWSMGLDIKILFKTVMVVLAGKGSK